MYKETMITATIYGNGNEEYVAISSINYLATTLTYADYVRLFTKHSVTHVVGMMGLEGDTALSDGLHPVEDFLAALAMFDAETTQVDYRLAS